MINEDQYLEQPYDSFSLDANPDELCRYMWTSHKNKLCCSPDCFCFANRMICILDRLCITTTAIIPPLQKKTQSAKYNDGLISARQQYLQCVSDGDIAVLH